MDYEYDESSREVVTTIAMIKSMTTTLRRKSSTTWIPTATNSPMLPQMNNGNEEAIQETFSQRATTMPRNHRGSILGLLEM